MENKKQQPKEPHVDTPSAFHESRHINFLQEEAKAENSGLSMDMQSKEDARRQNEREKDVEDGHHDQTDQPHFQKRDLNEQEEY